MTSALSSERRTSSRRGNVLKISDDGNGEWRKNPHLILWNRFLSRLGRTSR